MIIQDDKGGREVPFRIEKGFLVKHIFNTLQLAESCSVFFILTKIPNRHSFSQSLDRFCLFRTFMPSVRILVLYRRFFVLRDVQQRSYCAGRFAHVVKRSGNFGSIEYQNQQSAKLISICLLPMYNLQVEVADQRSLYSMLSDRRSNRTLVLLFLYNSYIQCCRNFNPNASYV